MEMDTGASVSLISEVTWPILYPKKKLQKTVKILRTYIGEKTQPLVNYVLGTVVLIVYFGLGLVSLY